MSSPRPRGKRARRPNARVRLPPLDAPTALALVAILEQLIGAIWRAHGFDMAEIRSYERNALAAFLEAERAQRLADIPY